MESDFWGSEDFSCSEDFCGSTCLCSNRVNFPHLVLDVSLHLESPIVRIAILHPSLDNKNAKKIVKC